MRLGNKNASRAVSRTNVIHSMLGLLMAQTRHGIEAFALQGFGTRIGGKEGTSLFSSPVDNEVDPSQPIVALNVILRVKPEVREQFLEVILNNQRGTMDKSLEPLALEYVFGEDDNEPNTFHFHEKYIGESGIQAHQAAPHFMVWEEFVQTDPFTSPPEVYKFKI